jgi:hypothetical protein
VNSARRRQYFLNAYITAIVAVFLWGPLIALHGYREWWVVMFYAAFIGAVIAGSISHYRLVRQNRKEAAHGAGQDPADADAGTDQS